MRTPQALETVCLQPQTGRMGLVGLESGCALPGVGTQETVFPEPRKNQRTLAGIKELSHGWGILTSLIEVKGKASGVMRRWDTLPAHLSIALGSQFQSPQLFSLFMH